MLTLALTLTLAACGRATSAPQIATNTTIVAVEGDYLGTVPGMNAGIAITTDGSTALIYIGDGTPTHVTYSTWIHGQISNNIINLTSSTNLEVSALLTADSANGTITETGSGQTFTFSATALTSRGGPGLYRSTLTANGVDYLGGWYELPADAAAGSAPTTGGAVVNQQTGALITSPTPDFTAMSVTVPGVGVFTLHYCHFGQCV